MKHMVSRKEMEKLSKQEIIDKLFFIEGCLRFTDRNIKNEQYEPELLMDVLVKNFEETFGDK